MALQLRRSLAGSPTHPAETGSLSYRLLVRLQLLSNPPHGDAVSFSHAWRDHHTAGTLTLLTKRPHGRTRDAHYCAPAAQIRTCDFPAYGSCLE